MSRHASRMLIGIVLGIIWCIAALAAAPVVGSALRSAASRDET